MAAVEEDEMKAPLLSVKALVKRFRGVIATDHLDLDVCAGEVHAIIGPNGAGKSTLIGQIAGELSPDEGCILLNGQDVTLWPVHQRALAGIGRSYQMTSVLPELTVLQNVMLAGYGQREHKCRLWSPASKDIPLRELANAAMERVGIADLGSTIAKNLGHGVSRQLELAMVLAMAPRMLLLDEPMAGMSQRESEEMTQLLLNLKGEVGILLVEHDLNAVFALANRITVLVYGRAIATGNADEIKSNPAVREAYLGDEEAIDV